VTVSGTFTEWDDPFDSSYLSGPIKEPMCQGNKEFCLMKSNQAIDEYISEQEPEVRIKAEYFSPSLACQYRDDNKDSCLISLGDEVVMYYWPPIQSSRDICAHNGEGVAITRAPNITNGYTMVTSALTFPGKDSYLLEYIRNNRTSGGQQSKIVTRYGPSVLQGPFTFTYPFVYIAHHPIRKFDFSGALLGLSRTTVISTVHPAGVIKLHSSDVFSPVWRERAVNSAHGLEYARLVAEGKLEPLDFYFYQGHREEHTTVSSFNFGDLENPVPAVKYYDARVSDCWGNQTHCGTITDDSYRPTLLIKNRAWFSAFPDFFQCRGAILHDPPKAISIQVATTVAEASLPTANPARPGDTAGSALTVPTDVAQVDAMGISHDDFGRILDAGFGDKVDREPHQHSSASEVYATGNAYHIGLPTASDGKDTIELGNLPGPSQSGTFAGSPNQNVGLRSTKTNPLMAVEKTDAPPKSGASVFKIVTDMLWLLSICSVALQII
jgi:hypothetical protein